MDIDDNGLYEIAVRSECSSLYFSDLNILKMIIRLLYVMKLLYDI